MTPQCQAEAAAGAAAGWSPCPGSPPWKCPWAILARSCGFHTGWMRGPFFLLYTRWDSQTIVHVPVEINCKRVCQHGLVHLLPALVPSWSRRQGCSHRCPPSGGTRASSHGDPWKPVGQTDQRGTQDLETRGTGNITLFLYISTQK